MNRPPTKAASGVRRATNVVVIAIMALGGLALAAGGGYMLLADDTIDLPTSMRQVLAEEVTSATPELTPEPQTGAPSLVIITPTAATGATSIALAAEATSDTPTPTATYVVEVRTPTATASVAPSPTPTRIVRVTGVATATATAVPGSDELPDTGFGEFLQPLAGLGLASLALVTHAVRRRR